jgi:hypothetical protein
VLGSGWPRGMAQGSESIQSGKVGAMRNSAVSDLQLIVRG